MGNTSSRTQRTYPRTIHLGNGTAMTLRLMSGADVDSLVSFARSLPVDDLLFLRMDITDPRVVQQWAAYDHRSETRLGSTVPLITRL